MKLQKFTAILLALITLLSVFSMTASAATYYVTRITEGDYFICASSNNSYAIDVIGGSNRTGTYVQLYNKYSDTNPSQIFSIRHYSGDWYKIINRSSGLCLNVSGGNPGNGVRLWMWSNSDNTDASLFRFASAPNGTYIIQNKLGKVLDLNNNLIYNGSTIHTWSLHDGASARWKLIPAAKSVADIKKSRASMQEGVSKITPTYASSYAINIQYKSTSVNSSRTVLDTYNSETNEQFMIKSIGDRYYTLAPMHCTGRYLSVNGSNITLSSSSSSYNSQWCFIKSGNGYTLINRGTNKSMAVYSYYTGASVSAAVVNTSVKAQNFAISLVECIISEEEIQKSAAEYGISASSNAYKALKSINTKYLSSFTSSQKKGVLVFMFEGVGSDSSSSKRMNAMCVVVKSGDIVYISRNCSTIPDYPFFPSKNGGTDMPTIKSGIYSFTTKNHQNKYAALNVSNANVLRFRSQNNYYSSSSGGINVHRRSTNTIAPSSSNWVNSAGCLLVGKSGTGSNAEYAKFIKAVGIVGNSANGDSKYSTYITGKIIIDRSYAYNYLSSIGYSSAAINILG